MLSTLSKAAFSVALTAIAAMGFLHVTATPAQALNCSFYERPGCEWVGWIEGCCYFEGPGCSIYGYRVGPCVPTYP